MAILDFPSSPTPGQIHTQNGKTWRWDASLNTWKSYNILGIQSGGTGLSGINAADAFLSSLNPVGLGLTYRQLIAGSGINIALTPSTVTFTSTGGGGAGNGTVDYGNTYEIPYYPSTGILVTGSPYFHNVGTGISILFNTPSISSKTGALTINGGVGIGGSLFVAGTASSISGIIINNSVITSGSWAGSTITMLYGGTGYASNNKGDILVGTGQSWFKLSYSASANDVLTVDTSTASGLKWAPVPPASASSVSVKSDNTAGPFYITFVNATDGSGLALSTDSNLSYNASTNALTASTFIGNLTGTASTATYADQSGFAITAGLATTATYSHQSGFASTSGLATTSSNIYLRQATENSDFYVTLSKNISGSGIALSAGSGLTFNPTTNTLSATSIIGTLLTANQPNITGVGTVISGVWSATAITSRYGGTGFTSYNKGDLLVGNGSSTLVKVPVGNTNDILIGSTFSGYGVSWVTLSPVYGAFASTNTQQVIAANTGTAVSFNSVFESNRVSLSTSGVGYSTRIYVHEPGVYNFQFSAQVDTVTTNQSTKGEFWFKKNGVDVPDSNSLLTINGKDDENIFALNFVSTILPDEYVELYYSSDKSDFRLLSLENLTSPTRPNIPSIIFTVTPVSNILPSTGIAISGIASINNETGPYQSLIVGSSGNDFVISSSSNTHTFNLPSASATARGLVTTTTQTFAGDKTFTGIVNATNITDSTSTTTGAAIVTGGLGVGGNAFIGGTVTAQLFTGNLSATAATATNFYGNLIGTATTATYAHQSGFAITAGLATTANYSHQSGFAITAGLATTATYSHQSGYAITSGLATTATYAHQSGFAVTAGLATTSTYAHQSGYAITSGLATTATYSHQSGFAITAGLATTSTNVNVASSGSTDSSHFLLFSRFNIGSGLAVSSAIGLSYTPSTGVLIGTTFQGNLQGNVLGNLTGTASTATYAHQSGYAITSGLATTSTNVNVVSSGSTSSSHFLLFTRFNAGTGLAVSSATGLSYIPSTGVLIGTTFQGNLQGNVLGDLTGTASTATYAHQSGYAITSGSATTASYAHQSGYAITTGTATTASNTNLVLNTSATANHPITFTPSTTTVSGGAQSFSTSVYIIPSSGTIVANALAASGITIGSATNTISTASGDLTLTSATNLVKVNNNLTIAGNLVVNGDTTSIGTTISTLLDPIFVLGAGVGGTSPSIDDNKDRGIEFRYFSGSAKTGFFGFDDSTGYFTFIPDGLNTNEVFSGTAGTAQFTTVIADLSGTASTATYSHQSGFAITSGLATTANYSHQSGFALTSGLATTATYSHQSGFAITSGFATTSYNISIANATTNQSHRIVFAPNSSLSGSALSSGATLLYNPSTDTLQTGKLLASSGQSARFYNVTSLSSGYDAALYVEGGLAVSNNIAVRRNVLIGSTYPANINSLQGAVGATFIRIISPEFGYNGMGVQFWDGQATSATDPTFALVTNAGGSRSPGLSWSGSGNSTDLAIYRDNTNALNIAVLDKTRGTLFDRLLIADNNGQGSQFTFGFASAGNSRNIRFATVSPVSGTDLNGGEWRFIGLRGTGNGTPGTFLFSTGDRDAANPTTAHSSTTALLIDEFGVIVGSDKGTNSTSTTTGTARINGGLGVTGNAFIGGTVNIQNSASSTGISSGALIVQGGVGISGNTFIGGNLSVWNGNELRLFQSNNVNYSGLKYTGGSNTPYILPTAYPGTATSFLTSDTNGNMFWIAAPSASSAGTVDQGTAFAIPYYPSAGSLVTGSSSFTNIVGSGISILYVTNSVSNSTGALVVRGGVGISGNAFIGGTVTASVFYGNIVGSGATITNIYGTLTGSATSSGFATTAGLATTAQNVNVASVGNTNTDHFLFFGRFATGTGLAVSSAIGLSYNPSTGIISGNAFIGTSVSANNFYGNLTGTAVTATNFYGTLIGTATTSGFATTSGIATTTQNVNVASVGNTNTDHFIFFGRFATGTGLAVSSAIGLSYNPATGIISGNAFIGTSVSASNFYGNLSGNAVTATNFYGTFNGTATTATSTNLVSNSVATPSHPITFTPSTTTVSGGAQSFNTNIYALPYAGIVVATGFTGALVGNVTGNVTGTATTSQNVNVASVGSTNTDHFIFFGRFATGTGLAVSSAIGLSYNPATGIISGNAFIGTSVTANNFFGNLSGTAVTATNFYGTLNGTATTATSTNLILNTVATTNHPITFTPSTTTVSGGAQSFNTNVYVIPSGGIIVATGFTGGLTGNVIGNLTGTATTSQNVNVAASGTTNTPHFLVFSRFTSGSGLALSTDSTINFNPTTEILSVSGISVTSNTQSTSVSTGALQVIGGVGITGNLYVGGTASSISGIQINSSVITSGSWSGSAVTMTYGGTGVTTNAKGDLLVGTGQSWLKLAYSANANDVLTVDSTTASGLKWASVPPASASSVSVKSDNTAGPFYLTFVNATDGSGLALSTDTTLTYNSLSNILSLGTGSLAANGVTVGLTANTISTATGDLTLSSASNLVKINNNLTISGNLIVNGDTTSIGTTISTLLDPIFVLGAGIGGTNPDIDDNKDRGIEFRYFSGTAKTGFFGFDDSTGYFTFIPDGLNNSEVFSGTAGTAQFTTVIANLTGFANTAFNLNTVNTSSSSTHYLTFSLVNGGSGVALSSSPTLQYVPSTSTLSASNFSGTLTGNVTGNLTGIATTATNVNVASSGSTNTSHFLLFSRFETGTGLAVSSATGLSYTPSTGVLIGTTFQGNLQGNVLGNVTGTATTATNVNLVSDTVATANNPLIFTPSTSTVSGGAQSFNANVYIIPSGGIIVATGFTGGLTGNVTGTATTATYANQSGYAITSGLASTSSNISIGSATANASHWLTFTPNQSLSGSAISTNTNLTYNPSTDTISATNLILNGTQAGGSNTTGALRVQGGVAVSGYLVANEFVVGISTVAVTNFNRWVTRHGGTRPDFTFYTGTNANPVIRLSDSFAAQHANQFPGIEFNGFSSQSFNTFGVGVGIAERNGAPVGNGISTLALFTSNGTAQVIRLSIPGGGSIGSTNLIIFGSSTSSNPNVTILRGVDANGTDANSGDFVIQPGRSTGSGSVGGIRFLLANPSTSGSTLNTPLDTVKFNPIQNSSSTTTGTVNIYGGLGLTGNAFIGGTVNIKNTTASIGISSGALVIDGGVGVGGTLNIGGNANIRSGYELRIFESGNSIYSGFKYTGGSNTPYILPTAYPGAATSFLTSDTSGNMYWIAAPSGGSGNPAGDNTQVQFNNSGSFGATSFFTYSNLTDTLTLSGNSITSPNLVITKTIADMGSTTPGIRLINNKVATGFTDLYSPKFEFLNGNYSAGSSKTTTFYLQTRTDSTLPGSNIFEIKYTNPNIGFAAPVTLLQGVGVTNGDLYGGYINFGVHGLIVQKQQNSASNYATGLYIGPNNDGFAGLAPVSFILSSAGSDGIDNVQVRARQFVNTPTNNGDYTWNLEIGPQTFGVNYPPIHSDDTTYTSVITATAVGSVIIQQAIDSYDSTSGALVVNGGFGLAGSAFIGGTITTANITNSSSTNSGAVVIAGGAGVGKSLSIGGRLQLFNGANYTAFLSSATSSTTYILPPTAPVVAAGSGISVLSSNNTGTMSWVRVASGFGSANRLARYDSSGFGFTESIISDTLGTGAGISIVPTRALTGSGIAQSSVLTIYSHITDDGGAASAGNSRFFHIRTFRSSGAESFAVANNGFLRARVKAFDIEHPSKPNKRLIHGCLEGPENGVYVRGTVEGKGSITIEFPEYWVPLTRDDYTVYLTPHGNYTVSIKEKNINSFTIQLNGNKYINRNKFYKVDYYAIANRKDVDFILEEDDINKKKF